MKPLMFGLLLSMGISATEVKAVETVTVDGVDYPLSVLTGNCNSMADKPEAMIACFTALSKLIEESKGGPLEEKIPFEQALGDLQAVAQYQDDDTGLMIAGKDCTIQVVYFGNYYHLSRRNVSTIDLFNARFDASKIQFDKITDVRGAPFPISTGVMVDGATAMTSGGIGIESTQQNFEPKSARSSLADYAKKVVTQLAPVENQTFDFVLVHPAKQKASTEIWNAFEVLADSCQS